MTDPTAETWADLLAALATPDGIAPAFAVTEAITRERIGCRLFTAMTSDPAAGYAARIHSSDPLSYPVSGRKPIVPNAWTAQVLDARLPFVANSIGAIAAVFPDHELIQALGCESCLNLPITLAGRVRGTINILDAAGHFTPERVERALALAPLYTVVMLAALTLETPR